MLKGKRILSGISALVFVFSLALPMRASAADDHGWDYHHDRHWEEHHRNDAHYHEWWWDRDHDHARAYTYTPGSAYHPANGEGMVDPRNPNLYWGCDGDGHHCHWTRR